MLPSSPHLLLSFKPSLSLAIWQSLKEELARAKSEAVATATSDLDKEAEQAARKHEFERLEAELSSSLNLKLEERDQYHARATEAIKAEAAEATRTLVAQHAQVIRVACIYVA